LAGILALSTYSPTAASLENERSGENLNIQIKMAHGTYDPVIPASLGLETCRALMSLDYNVQWNEYPMEHQVCIEEIESIGLWLNGIFNG
jgi:phospholipase/carboxylesterase